MAEQEIEPAEEGAAASHHDPFIHDIRRELGRRMLQGGPDGFDDRHHRLPKGFADFIFGDDDGFRDPVNEVASFHLGCLLFATGGIGRPQTNLDILRPALSHQKVIVFSDVLTMASSISSPATRTDLQ